MTASETDKWAAYPHTILEFYSDTGPTLRVDLRCPVSEADRGALRQAAPQAPFAVFTAQNPEGEHAEDAASRAEEKATARANDRRETALKRALRALEIPFRRVDGVAPDGSYREECVAASLDRAQAVELARRLDQLAIFWFDGSAFWLIPALADQDPVRLPRS